LRNGRSATARAQQPCGIDKPRQPMWPNSATSAKLVADRLLRVSIRARVRRATAERDEPDPGVSVPHASVLSGLAGTQVSTEPVLSRLHRSMLPLTVVRNPLQKGARSDARGFSRPRSEPSARATVPSGPHRQSRAPASKWSRDRTVRNRVQCPITQAAVDTSFTAAQLECGYYGNPSSK
jgi:hypothetical protein